MIKRGRRIRETAAIRAMVRENILTANAFRRWFFRRNC